MLKSVDEQRCVACGGRVAWTRGMVACLPGDGVVRCGTPLCQGCGQEMVHDDRCQRTRSATESLAASVWMQVLRPEYPASDNEIVSMQALLADRGLPASDRFAQSVLTALADSRTRCVFEGMADRDVEITYDDVRRLLGHDLSLIDESSPPDR